jgi:hypothetical protein
MIASVQDSVTLRTVRPIEVATYLRTQGWEEVQVIERGSFWIKQNGTISYEVLIPSDLQTRDYPLRVSELLKVLAQAEQRSQFEIIEDLSFANADIIRPRLLGASSDGTISIEAGKAVYEQARDLMLAAACAAVGPREVYSKRKSEQAMNYLSHARFGIPKRGSYILTIISPVTPKLKIDKDLFGNAEPREPFERRTVRVLAEALSELAVSGPRIAATGDLALMKNAVRHGVSANLCDALVEMNQSSGERGIDFRFSWAPSRGVPSGAKTDVSISPDIIPILKETSRLFRETGTQEGVEVIGTAHKLQHAEGNRGKVTLFGAVDGEPRSITLDLEGREHDLAVRSYQERIPLICFGSLVREGRAWVLKNLRNLDLLDSPQANVSDDEVPF